ncbi:MAG: type II toxin-antitoxin system RelB/DinJ family antitoxin [Oscillospiraceae bacterium]
MAQAMVNFRMDADLKASMEKVCKKMGMSRLRLSQSLQLK